MKLSLLAEAALRLLYPESCNACSAALPLTETTLCGPCTDGLETRRTALENPSPAPFLKRHWALYSYESPAKELLRDLKFHQKTWILKAFRAAFEDFARSFNGEIDFIVPVPVHYGKLLTREFNQSFLIAKILGKKTGKPVLQALAKPHATPLQSSLSREERSVNLRGAFKVRRPEKLRGKTVLLVDDIFTTGATAGEAARVLKEAGAKRIELFTIARTELGKKETGHS